MSYDLLDENRSNFINPESVSPRPTGMKYGVIGGVGAVILGLVSHLLGWDTGGSMVGSMVLGLASLGLAIFVIYTAIKYHRDNELGGYISLGRCVMLGLWSGLFYGIVAGVWQAIFTMFIVPDFAEKAKQSAIEQYEKQGMSEEQIEAAMGMVNPMMDMMSNPLVLIAYTLVAGIISGVILSLIIGAFSKNDPPMNRV